MNRFLLALLGVVLLGACTHHARLYNLSTGEIATVAFKYSGTGKGAISGVLPSGEVVSGEYITVPSGTVAWGNIFGSVYGAGGMATVSGGAYQYATDAMQRGSAIATGDRGTVVECEYVTRADSATGYGACRDNHGNQYRLMFGG